jgi:hypothetical protein
MHSALGALLFADSNVFFDTLQGITRESRIVAHPKHAAIHILQMSGAGAKGAR